MIFAGEAVGDVLLRVVEYGWSWHGKLLVMVHRRSSILFVGKLNQVPRTRR